MSEAEELKRPIDTKVSKTINGYQVTFSIGHQTFYLSDQETKKEAKWFEKNLKIAFEKLSISNFSASHLIEERKQWFLDNVWCCDEEDLTPEELHSFKMRIEQDNLVIEWIESLNK